MRITIVTGPFQALPPAGCGAIERRWLNVARQFSKKGHHVEILARFHNSQKRDEYSDGVYIRRRTKLRRTGVLFLDLLQDLAYSFRMIMLLKKADILVVNTFWLPILAVFLPSKLGIVAYNVARFPKGQIRFYSHIPRLFAVSTAIREAIKAECPKAINKIKTIPNPIDTDVFKPSFRKNNTWQDKKNLVYTGRIHPEKGIHLLIKAFRNLVEIYPNLQLQIVGPSKKVEGGGGTQYMDYLKSKSVGLPVFFHKPVYDSKALSSLLGSADFYCYPSIAEKGESFGVAPLEAMATGLPPIVSDLNCFRDFIEHGVNGVVFNHRADDPVRELTCAIKHVIRSEEKYDNMSKAAAERAKAFSYSKIADLYLEDFQELSLKKTRLK